MQRAGIHEDCRHCSVLHGELDVGKALGVPHLVGQDGDPLDHAASLQGGSAAGSACVPR